MSAAPITRPDALHAELTALFARDLSVEVPSPDTDLLATGRLDSVAIVELLLQLEQRYGVRVPVENLEIEQFRSVSAIAAFVLSHSNDNAQ